MQHPALKEAPIQNRIPKPKMSSSNDFKRVLQKPCSNVLSNSTAVTPPYRPRVPLSHGVTHEPQMELHQEVVGDFQSMA